MIEPIVVRATMAHLDLLAPLFDAYRVFYEQPTNIAAARAYLAERLQKGQSTVFLATDEAGQIGYGFTQLYPTFSSVSMSQVWVLYDLFVAPTARRQGIGRLLMENAHYFARASGARGVSLATAVTNTNAQTLYESLGYVRDEDFYYYDLKL
jgi:ribosomal protein S18 acetylase RimI-like enzyme